MTTDWNILGTAISPVSLACVLDQSPDCVKLISRAGDIRYVNENGQLAMEISEPETLIGRKWVDFWPKDARAKVEDAYRMASKGMPAKFQAFARP